MKKWMTQVGVIEAGTAEARVLMEILTMMKIMIMAMKMIATDQEEAEVVGVMGVPLTEDTGMMTMMITMTTMAMVPQQASHPGVSLPPVASPHSEEVPEVGDSLPIEEEAEGGTMMIMVKWVGIGEDHLMAGEAPWG